MRKILVDESDLTAIASKIREKIGTSSTYKPKNEMANAIGTIVTENNLDNPVSIIEDSVNNKIIIQSGYYSESVSCCILEDAYFGGTLTSLNTDAVKKIDCYGLSYFPLTQVSLPECSYIGSYVFLMH